MGRWMVGRPSVVVVVALLLGVAGPAAADVGLVKDIQLGALGSSPSNLIAFAGKVFFGANDGVVGEELWTSDGTAAGTGLVKDINTGGSSVPSEFAVMNGLLFFVAANNTSGRELFRSDGTTGGTVLVKNISIAGSSSPSGFTVMNNVLYFTADDGVNGRELWRSDGSDTGTSLVKNINPGGSGGVGRLEVFGGKLYFSADDGTNGSEVWVSDGTMFGTTMLKDINPTGSAGPAELTVLGNLLMFRASDGVNGSELWETDGTPGGTVMVRDINPAGSSLPNIFFTLKDTLLFVADDGLNGVAFWRSDGTTAGTTLLKDVRTTPGTAFFQHIPAILGDKAIFAAVDDTHGNEPWVTDGTPAGTMLLVDISPGPPSSVDSQPYIAFGGRAFFRANDVVHSRELWMTDGTPAGTVLVGEVNPGSGDGVPQLMTAAGGRIFFNCDLQGAGQELCAATFPPLVTGAGAVSGPIGAPFSHTVTVSGLDPKTIGASGLPPGLALTGDVIAGTPIEIGVFPVTLSVDTLGGATTAAMEITIEPLPNPGPSDTTLDSDGDGFVDEIETAVGSSPTSSTSTPLDGAPADAAKPLTGTKLKVNLNFAHGGRDTLAFRCLLPIPQGFNPVSARLVVDVGGVVRTVQLSPRRFRSRGGLVLAQNARFALTVKRGDLVGLLADEGLANTDAKREPRTVPVVVLLDRTLLRADLPQIYTAKTGKFGRGR